MTVRNGTATPDTAALTMVQDRGAPAVLPHDLRADQGNPEITTWCPKCEERVVVLRDGTCGWCNTDLSTPDAPAPGPESTVQPRTREDLEVALWRRAEIFDWLIADGPKTVAEIRARFDTSDPVARKDVDQLRLEGRLELTGAKRSGPGAGRAAAEFRAVVRDQPSHAQTGDAEAEQPAAEAPPGDAADDDRTIEEGHHDEHGEPAAVGREVAAPITLHEQLVVRYIGCLISWIERSSIVRDQGPPDHVYDRIERLLQIQDGAA